MMHTRSVLAAVLGSGTLALLAGCAGPIGPSASQRPAATPPHQWQTPGPRGGVCEAAPAQAFIGQPATARVIEKARIASGAAIARVLHPNQPTTREFNRERLNLLLDAQGKLASAHCS